MALFAEFEIEAKIRQLSMKIPMMNIVILLNAFIEALLDMAELRPPDPPPIPLKESPSDFWIRTRTIKMAARIICKTKRNS